MARAESKMIMGYLPIEPKHHAAILSLVAPATPYANKLDGDRVGSTCSASTWMPMPNRA